MKKRTTIFLGIMLSLALLVGCSGSKDFKAEINFFGSSTLAPVISAIATDFIESNKTWNKVNSDLPAKNIAIYVTSGGSGAGVKAVMEDTSDFGMLAREVRPSERESIEDIQEYVLGIDALTVSINPNNPLAKLRDNLNTEEIMKIFSGQYKYWDDLDKRLDHKEIVVVIRDLGGGAHEVFQNSIMGDVQVRSDAIQAPSMGALVTKIIENQYTIGYASYGMVNQNLGKLTPLKVDGIEATEQNIRNGRYKVSRPLVLVKKGQLTPSQKAFMDYIQARQGTQIVEDMGFVSMN